MLPNHAPLDDRRAVRHARDAAPGADRPRPGPRAGERPDHHARPAPRPVVGRHVPAGRAGAAGLPQRPHPDPGRRRGPRQGHQRAALHPRLLAVRRAAGRRCSGCRTRSRRTSRPMRCRTPCAIYRSEFRPSAQLDAPYVIAGVNVHRRRHRRRRAGPVRRSAGAPRRACSSAAAASSPTRRPTRSCARRRASRSTQMMQVLRGRDAGRGQGVPRRVPRARRRRRADRRAPGTVPTPGCAPSNCWPTPPGSSRHNDLRPPGLQFPAGALGRGADAEDLRRGVPGPGEGTFDGGAHLCAVPPGSGRSRSRRSRRRSCGRRSRPADRAVSTARSSSAQEISKSSRIEAWEASSRGPMAAGPGGPAAPPSRSTRWFSVTTWRTRRKVSWSRSPLASSRSSEPDVAQAPHAKDLGGEFARFPAGRIAAVGVGMAETRVSMTSSTSPGVGVERHQPASSGPGSRGRRRGRRGPERGGLVHDAGGRADEVVLRPLGGGPVLPARPESKSPFSAKARRIRWRGRTTARRRGGHRNSGAGQGRAPGGRAARPRGDAGTARAREYSGPRGTLAQPVQDGSSVETDLDHAGEQRAGDRGATSARTGGSGRGAPVDGERQRRSPRCNRCARRSG